MIGILMTVLRARINDLAFVRTNNTFSKSGGGDAEAEHKQNDLAKKKRQINGMKKKLSD